MLMIIPEHFLICGVLVAILLPTRRLPRPVSIATIDGHGWRRGLRWLGLAQPGSTADVSRLLAWFGLSRTQFITLIASGALFWSVHIGKNNLVEIILSFPGGVAVAYLTLRAHSIWPAIVAHWSMNLIPLALLAILR